MAKLRGRETCNMAFILAFLEAKDNANKLGKTVPIVGFGGWFCAPSKDLNNE